jgi:hypothetical protein
MLLIEQKLEGLKSMAMKSKKTNLIKILVALNIIIYMVFTWWDIFNKETFISSDVLKFMSMIIVFIISIMTKKDALSFKDLHLLQIGLFITLIADLLLLLLDNHYILGIFLFSIVQILYSLRYEFRNFKLTIRNFFIIFLSLSILYIIINKFVVEIDFLWAMGLFYGLCLLNSVIKAFKAYKYKIYPEPNRQMILIGMILFLLCDINVALYNILGYMGKVNVFYNISSVSMWLFYLPSQILLALSGYNYNMFYN